MINTIRGQHPEVTQGKAEAFLDYMDKSGRMIKHKAGISLFFRVNDFMLSRISKNPKYVMKEMQSLIRSEGQNIHIFSVMKNDSRKDKVNLFRELSRIILEKKPKSISWWNNTQTKFYYKEC